MTAKVLMVGIQKGGTSKTTTNATLGFTLSDMGYRVLLVDMDPQGNLTEMTTGLDPEEFEGETILEAMVDMDARSYIYEISDKLHIVPADDNLAIFSRHIYSRFVVKDDSGQVKFDEDGDIVISPEAGKVLKYTLESVRPHYDFILIDTPPSLGDNTVNALIASDGVIVIYETSPFCYTAVRRFLQSVRHCQLGANANLKVYGILPTMIDQRRSDSKAYLELIHETYGDMVFNTVIRRQAAIGRLPVLGFDREQNKELDQALELYREFIGELFDRIKKNRYFPIPEELVAR